VSTTTWEAHVAAEQQDPQGDPEQDPAERFGGEATSVTPDGAPSSRWDQDAEDEDALMGGGSQQPNGADIPPVEDARANGDVAGL
jgi:hypothetical protein